MATRSSHLTLLFTLLVLASWGTLVDLSREVPAAASDDDLELVKQFEEWMNKNGRVYTCSQEKETRFEENVAKIGAHNKVETRSFDMGVNGFADMTFKKLEATYTGEMPFNLTEIESLGLYRVTSQMNTFTTSVCFCMDAPFKGGMQSEANKNSSSEYYDDGLPSSYDWRDLGAVTAPILEQGFCNSCWAFAAASAIESIHFIKTGQLLNLSRQQLIDCDDYFGTTHGCKGGFTYYAYKWTAEYGGLVSEDEYPYKGKTNVCGVSSSTPGAATITGASLLYYPISEADLKAAVVRQPVTVKFMATEDFFNYDGVGLYKGAGCGSNVTISMTNHALLVVGYNTDEFGSEYWVVKNSWGRDWGDLGWGYIAKGSAMPPEGVCGMYLFVSWPVID